MQPCVSPVWDTAIAACGAEEAGLPPDHPCLRRRPSGCSITRFSGPGDWQIKNRDAAPGGWAFEFRNDFYPDVDDTAFVLMALQSVPIPTASAGSASMRGMEWLVSMQNRDGGWGAFDRDNDRAISEPDSVRRSQRDDRSIDAGRDRARAGVLWPHFGWTAADDPRSQRRNCVSAQGANARWALVWPLGSQLRVRHQRRVCGRLSGWH